MSNKVGKVIQVIGAVIDVRFSSEEDLPNIYNAIHDGREYPKKWNGSCCYGTAGKCF